MPFKIWAIGEEVLAADFQSYMQDQVVAIFPSAAARDAAYAAPKVGQVCYLTDVHALFVYDGVGWSQYGGVRTFSTALGAGAAGAGPLVLGTINIPAQPRPYSLEAVATWIGVPTVSGDTWILSTRVANNPIGAAQIRASGTNLTMTLSVASSQLYAVAANTAAVVTAVLFRTAGTGNMLQGSDGANLNMLTARCYS
jgi:hypothetical protein